MKNFVLVLAISLVGCATQKIEPPVRKTTESYFTHPEHGEVISTDERYIAARKECQSEIYKNGVMIGQEVKRDPDELNGIPIKLRINYFMNRLAKGMKKKDAYDSALDAAGIGFEKAYIVQHYRGAPTYEDVQREYDGIAKPKYFAEINELNTKTKDCVKTDKKFTPSRFVIKNKDTGEVISEEITKATQ